MDNDQSNINQQIDFDPLLPFPEGIDVDEWMLNAIHPFIKGRTLEIGSSDSKTIEYFLKNDLPLHLSHPDRETCQSLQEAYKDYPRIRAVHKIEMHRPDFEKAYSTRLNRFNTVFKLNGSANEIDKTLVLNASLLLKQDGKLIILIPLHTVLYSGMEVDLATLKAHNRSYLRSLFTKLFEVRNTKYVLHPTRGLVVIVTAEKI